MKKLSNRIIEKSLNATLAALEIYNKPECNYREENFCILIVNAFELLFKAKILKDNNEDVKKLYVYYYPKNKSGGNSKKKAIKKNRIGQPFTIDIIECIKLLESRGIISNNLKENINLLIEIRDNAIHLINNNSLKIKLYKICAASIRNYALLIEKWFPEIDIKKINFFITPLNFSEATENYSTINLNVAQRSFLNYIEIASNTSNEQDEYDLLINVDVKFVKNSVDESVLLKYAKEGKKIEIELTEDMFKKMYPFDNKQIIEKIKERKPDIKINPEFNKIKKKLQGEEKCCKARYLDFVNKKGGKKMYYNSGFIDKILEEYGNN